MEAEESVILMYHKIFPEIKSEWWVSPRSFQTQMSDLRNKQIVYLDDYNPLDPSHCVITFDDAYQNVLEHAVPILSNFGYPFEVFVIGKCALSNYMFESSEPHTNFANEKELYKMVQKGGRLQWHSWSHPHLMKISNRKSLELELTVPKKLRSLCTEGFKWFSYPFGERDESFTKLVKNYFEGALAIDDGNFNDRYEFMRIAAFEDSRFN